MKKTASTAAVVAVLVLGGYYGMGSVTESSVKRTIAVINEQQKGFLEATVTHYDRGWFTSKADVTWKVTLPDDMAKSNGENDVSFSMPLHIYHGPFIVSPKGVKFGMGYAYTDIHLPEKFMASVKNMMTPDTEIPPVTSSILVTYLNNADVSVDVPKFSWKAKDGSMNGTWQGFSAVSELSSQLEKLSGKFSLKGLQMTKDTLTTVVKPAVLHYKMYLASEGFYVGDADWSLDGVDITNGTQSVLQLKDMTFKLNSAVDAGLFSSTLDSSVDKIHVLNQSYGPGQIVFSLRNLDAETIAKINEISQNLHQGSEVSRQQATLSILPLLPKLVSRGPELEVSKFHMELPEGNINGQLKLVLPKSEGESNPFQLIQKIHGDGYITVPESFLKSYMVKAYLSHQTAAATTNSGAPLTPAEVESSVTTSIGKMVNLGLLVKDGSEYKLAVRVSDGKLLVNDKPFTPAMLQF